MIAILLAGCFTGSLMAQEKPAARYNEFGIIFSDLNNFGLRYKHGGEKTSLRVSVLTMNLTSLNQTSDQGSGGSLKDNLFGGGIRLGFDSKVKLFSTFCLLLGAEAGLSYHYQHYTGESDGITNDERKVTSLVPSLSFIFGVNYILKDHLVLGAEINPSFLYIFEKASYSKPTEYTEKSQSIQFNLASTGAGLYIAYRFGK